MKKILVVAQFTQLPGEAGNNRGRFKLICELLANEGYDVTEVTSKFRELDRSFRDSTKTYKNEKYKVIILKETGYKKSIGLRRLISMTSFAHNLSKYLHGTQEKYDLIYACVPGLDSALVAGKYAKKNNIPFLIDVQDVWPEVMYDIVLDIPIISQILFSPLQFMANKVYSLADGVIAVSETYLNIAKKHNTKSTIFDYVYIGTDLDKFDKGISTDEKKILNKQEDEFWISYIGTLGHSYDIKTFLDASKLVQKRGINVKAIIIGSGPLENNFKEHARQHKIDAVFTGWLDHTTMSAYLNQSDAVINAIKKKAQQSITNKIGDYLSAGKPILNGSLNEEFKNLLSTYNFGINYIPEDPISLASKIEQLYYLKISDRVEMGCNARKLAEKRFDRKYTYTKIVNNVNVILNQNEI